MIEARVTSVRAIARDILCVELAATHGRALPGADAGSHIDLQLAGGLVRQYSITNALGHSSQASYEIAVARDAQSRGGSQWVHDQLRPGMVLSISEPRNHFALQTQTDGPVLFIGGGIGITPLYAMARTACDAGMDWHLVACARSMSRLAYAEELVALDPSRVRLHGDLEQGQPLALASVLRGRPWSAVYACGPGPMLQALEEVTADWSTGRVHTERFKALQHSVATVAAPFVLQLARSGQTVGVGSGESVLEVLERLGIDHPSACREGLCGTCQVEVLDGEPDHRDAVLDAAERTVPGLFIPCISRCHGERLTINL